jgi:hypothetical protein
VHALKVAALLLLTLAAMRAVSWGIGWGLSRIAALEVFPSAVVANVIGLATFTGFIVWNLLPGEPFDYTAFGFGVLVYATCLLADLKWRPWHRDGHR